MLTTTYNVITIQDKQIGLQLPNNYDPSRAYPLIVFLHGFTRSVINSNFTLPEFSDFRSKAAERGYIVMAPDYGSNRWINPAAEDIVLQSITLLQSQYKIDPQRLYLMGVSMGGGGALVFSARHKEMVAAVCDIMGVTDMVRLYNDKDNYQETICSAYGGNPSQVPDVYAERSALNHVKILSSIPVFITHGSDDTMVSALHSDDLYNGLKNGNGTVEYVKVPGLGHDNALIKGMEDRILNFFDKSSAIPGTN